MRLRISFEISLTKAKAKEKNDAPDQHYHPDTESSIERAEPFIPYFQPGPPEERR